MDKIDAKAKKNLNQKPKTVSKDGIAEFFKHNILSVG